MAIDVWFRDDMARILRAADCSMAVTVAQLGPIPPSDLRAFQRGYRAALAVVALACGLAVGIAKVTETREVSRVNSVDL